MNKLAALLLAAALISPAFAEEAKKPETTKIAVKKDCKKSGCKTAKKDAVAPAAPSVEKKALIAEEKAPQAATYKAHRHHRKSAHKVRKHHREARVVPVSPGHAK